MHNLHLVVVKADSAEDACSEVESYIMDFGNENNWRTICGAVSSKNEVHDNDGEFAGRYLPKDTAITIETINKMVEDWMEGSFYGDTAKKKIDKGQLDLTKWKTSELYSLEKYAKDLYQIAKIKEGKAYAKKTGLKVSKGFNVLTDEYYAYDYDECGVTQMDSEGKETYVVFVDMHS